MNVPAVTSFKDVNSDMKMAPIDVEKANEYMDQFGVSFDDKVVDLYDEHFLLYLRLSLTDTFDFINSACRAEMKKKITYRVDISLQKKGFIHEAQCECGAGEGPTGHCKHIRTVLLACCKFIKSFELKVESSCTEKLQTFHKAKKHTGTPLKARNLKVAGADSVCDFKDYDPRPEHLRNKEGYSDYFRNVCLNFKGISDTPIVQAFNPGNIRAFNADHDYFKETHEQKFLRDNKLVTVTDSNISAIEFCTRGQSQNQRWFEEREKRIQSSNFYRICVATARTNKDTLARALVHGSSIKANDAIKHGHKFEKEAIHAYEQKSKLKVNSCGIFVSKKLPFLGASPDGVISDELICEVKCPYSAKNKDISPVTVPYLKMVDGKMTLSKKHPYYYQVQGQLFCTEASFCDFIIYTITDFKCIRVEREHEFISVMLDKLQSFYDEHFRLAVGEKFFFKDF